MQVDIQSARHALSVKNFALAASQYQELITKSPLDHILYLELSSALMGLSKFDEALVVIKQIEAFGLSIDDEIQLQKANIYIAQGRIVEAIPILQILHFGRCEDRVRTSLSSAFIQLGFPSKAAALFDKVNKEKLSVGDINNLAISLCEQMQPAEALELLTNRIVNNQHDASTISNVLMLSNYIEGEGKHISIAKTALKKLHGVKKSSRLAQSINDMPKIGFISGDMNQHPVGWFSIGFLRELSKDYSVTVYYTDNKIDKLTHDLISAVTDFRFVESLNDTDLIKQIQADNIAVLIDLSGHTAKNRISIFSHRIVPAQLSYLGYFASTYMPHMDGVIFDQWHLKDLPEQFFSESIYQLPCSRFCYTAPPYTPPIDRLPALSNGIITFCSFSSTSKVNHECIEMWSKTLIAIPFSRIQLRWKSLRDPQLRRQIRALFLSNGIVNSRVELYADCDHESLFHFYNEVDIALDTYPFSGATTCCEALWMGVPVITRTGKTPASNQASSILHEIGLSECVTNSIDDFVEVAKRLACDTQKLSNLRANLRLKLSDSSLGNAKLFTAHLAELINQIYREKIEMVKR